MNNEQMAEFLEALANNSILDLGAKELQECFDTMRQCAQALREAEDELQVLRRIEKQEIWYWQGGGMDYPESLACPVIMKPEKLRAMLATIKLYDDWFTKRDAQNAREEALREAAQINMDLAEKYGNFFSDEQASVRRKLREGATKILALLTEPALQSAKTKACAHTDYSFQKHGRFCHCGALMTDFGD